MPNCPAPVDRDVVHVGARQPERYFSLERPLPSKSEWGRLPISVRDQERSKWMTCSKGCLTQEFNEGTIRKIGRIKGNQQGMLKLLRAIAAGSHYNP